MPEVEAKTVPEYDPVNLQDYLPIYYKRIFPHKPFYRWLSYGLCKLIFFFIFISENSLKN